MARNISASDTSDCEQDALLQSRRAANLAENDLRPMAWHLSRFMSERREQTLSGWYNL